jgi:hypothetical protein
MFKIKNIWIYLQVPQEFQAEFQIKVSKENVNLVLIGAVLSGIAILTDQWTDWQLYQKGLFERVPSYRWLFYSHMIWWLQYGIPINFALNWSRIKKGDYPLAQLNGSINAILIFVCLVVLFRIACMAQTSILLAFVNYLMLLFILSFFYLDYWRRLLLIFFSTLAVILIFVNVGNLIINIYSILAAIFALTFSNAWYNEIVKNFLMKKVLEEQTHLSRTQSDLLTLQNQIIENQKMAISKELEISRRQLTTTALMLVRKSDLNDLLKKEVSGLEETALISKIAKNKLLKIIDQTTNEEDEWARFQQQFEQLEPSFLKNIMNNFPALTPKDLKILTLIRMNLDSNEITRILRTTPESTKKARYRLRKRLGLSEEESLEQFVNSFE